MKANITTDKPVFQHDCDNCVFLGNFKNVRGWEDEDGNLVKLVDLYICCRDSEYAENRFTPIVRFGECGDYSSGACFMGNSPDLYEAGRRAVKHGLIKKEDFDEVLKTYPKTIED